MKHFQAGMIITLTLDVDMDEDSEAAFYEWADKTANAVSDNLPQIPGVEYRLQKIIHPQHLLDLQEAVDDL